MYKKLDINYYLELQRRLENIILYVSLHEDNYNTYSIKIENLFVDTCAFFDSLCQTMIVECHTAGKTFESEGEIGDFIKKAEGIAYFNINDYQKIFEKEYTISNYEINLNCHIDYFLGNPIYYFDSTHRTIDFKLIKPFENWAVSTNPDWWGNYTSLKHNRLDNIKVGNFKNLVYALAGTFIILSLKNEITFKSAQIDKEIYNVFFPNYWTIRAIDGARSNLVFS
jgi:hypothetical protein